MVKLHLKDHCIETEAKMEYRRLMGLFFTQENPSSVLVEMLDVLRIFIEQEDFPALRSSDGRLCGMVESAVLLGESGDHVSMRIVDWDEQMD